MTYSHKMNIRQAVDPQGPAIGDLLQPRHQQGADKREENAFVMGSSVTLKWRGH